MSDTLRAFAWQYRSELAMFAVIALCFMAVQSVYAVIDYRAERAEQRALARRLRLLRDKWDYANAHRTQDIIRKWKSK